jgi:N-terminal acetyltransferase B complex non-catalytic subunit
LAEAFHDILGYKPPQMYKVPIAATASDQTFAMESLCRLNNSLAKFIDKANPDLTRPERVYYQTISILGNLVLLCAEGRPADLDEHCIQLSKALEIALDSLRSQIPPSTGHETEDQVTLLSSMHVLAVYRETANAIRLGLEWILAFTDQDKEWNRGKGKILGKQATEQLKLSINLAQKALKNGKEKVAGLKNTMSSQGGFHSRFTKWLFEDAPGVKSAVADAAVVDLVAYLGENIDAWQQIKWE